MKARETLLFFSIACIGLQHFDEEFVHLERESSVVEIGHWSLAETGTCGEPKKQIRKPTSLQRDAYHELMNVWKRASGTFIFETTESIPSRSSNKEAGFRTRVMIFHSYDLLDDEGTVRFSYGKKADCGSEE